LDEPDQAAGGQHYGHRHKITPIGHVACCIADRDCRKVFVRNCIRGCVDDRWKRKRASLPLAANHVVGRLLGWRTIGYDCPHLAERMKVSLGQPIVIENVNGAAGSIAVGRAARAAPDGYTIALGDGSTFVSNPAMYKLPYDVVDDFEPISMLPYAPQIIVAKSTVPAKNLSELLAWIKTSHSNVSYGTSGVGSPSYVSAMLLQNITGTEFQLVSYRGAGQIMTDIISGHIDLSIAAPTVVLEQWRAGKVRAFAVTGKARISAAPDIPTVDEAGLPGFYTSLWWGLWVPRGAPDYVIAKLNAAVVESLADPLVRERFAEQGLDMPTREQQRPEALRAFQKAEIEKWWSIIKAASTKTQ
jgi:tripartite-type tricarboxylate transporter receptor subunit TctC